MSKRTARRVRPRFLALLGALVLIAGVLFALGVATISFAAPAPPAPTISVNPPNPSNSQAASFTYTDAVAITKFQCKLDTGSFGDCGTTRPSMKNYSGLVAGSHTFQVKAVSGSGTSSATSYAWVIDLTAPTAVSINRVGPSPTHAASVHWTATFSEPVTGVDAGDFALVKSLISGASSTVSVSGSGTTYTATMASTGTGDGSVGLNLVDNDSIVDAAGNKLGGTGAGNGNKTGQVFTIDRTPPPAPTIVLGPIAWPPIGWQSTSAAFTFTGPVDAASYLCRMDAAAFAACVSPKSYAGLAQGQHTFDVKAVDAAENISLTAASRTFFVDTVAPAKPIFSQTPPDPNSTATSTFAWSSTDPAPASGIAGYLCSKENGVYLPCSSPYTYNVQTTSNGQHQFAVVAVDWAGNISQAASYKWKVAAGTHADFTVAGSVSGLMIGVWKSIPITITNPNSDPISVTILTVAVSGSPNGCDAPTNFETQPSVVPFTVPANAVNYAVPLANQPQIRLKNLPGPSPANNQNNCKNQTINLAYSGSANGP
jgi:Bacterial Ig-like domain